MHAQQPRHVKQLWFTPYAWAKLLYMCHWSEDEVGAMGLANADDPFLIEDLWIPKQVVSTVSTRFDMDDFAVTQMQLADPDSPTARHPRCFRRVWIHTHPAGSAAPSHMDERTFEDVVGRADWGVMFIMSKDGQTYCRLRARAGDVLMDSDLAVGIAWAAPFPASSIDVWETELQTNVHERPTYVVPEPDERLRTTSKLLAAPAAPKVSTTPAGSPKSTASTQLELLPGVRPKRAPRPLRVIAHNESILNGISGRQMALLVTSHIALGELTPATITILDKAGVTVANKDLLLADKRSTVTAQFSHSALPQPVSSPGLLNIDRIQTLESTIMEPADLTALENDLLAVAADRVLGLTGQTDSNEEPLEVAYPWLTHDGTILLLSNDEIGSLLDEITGKLVDSAADLGHSPRQMGFFLEDEEDKDVESIAETVNRLMTEQPAHQQLRNEQLERAIKEILTLITTARNEGATVDVIEQRLTLLATKARAEGWLPEAMFKINQLRARGYSLVDPQAADEQQVVNNALLEQFDYER